MSDDTVQSGTLRYDIWVEEALRSVIQKTLTQVAAEGLPGDHHFYISFHTQDDGVEMPGRLRAQHPNDMTIVLQYQFEDLDIGDDAFGVTLSFGGMKERLVVPFASIISFADPSVNFALQLKMMPMDEEDFDEEGFAEGGDQVEPFEPAYREGDQLGGAIADDDEHKSGEVITLDAFRKK